MLSDSKIALATAGLIFAAAATGTVAEEITGAILLEAEEEGTVFGYDGEVGPEFWGGLDPNWATCKNGRSQSPINISVERAKRGNIPDIVFSYQESAFNVLNNGHTVQVNYDSGSYIEFAGTRYDLLQFHFHSPSEHVFQSGAQFEVEMHLVHRSAEGNLAVVAVLINQGEENSSIPEAGRVEQILPRAGGVKYFLDAGFNVGDLLPDDRRAYAYKGSLTTPPCSEDVQWLVLKDPIEFSAEQIEAMNEALDNLEFASEAGTNNRPAQPLNGRKIRLDTR